MFNLSNFLGSLHCPRVHLREDLTLERYALGEYNELCIALGGLVEEE